MSPVLSGYLQNVDKLTTTQPLLTRNQNRKNEYQDKPAKITGVNARAMNCQHLLHHTYIHIYIYSTGQHHLLLKMKHILQPKCSRSTNIRRHISYRE